MSIKLMTLCMIRKNGRILLGMKKRGFGAGRWNGFGGKVHEGETVKATAKRETQEESGVLVEEENLEEVGVLDFQFKKNPDETLQVHIFKALRFSNEPRETEEMKPQWFDDDKIPYEEMWSGDPHWLPLFLSDKKFEGRFLFDDNDQILEKRLELIEKNNELKFK